MLTSNNRPIAPSVRAKLTALETLLVKDLALPHATTIRILDFVYERFVGPRARNGVKRVNAA